MKSIERVPHRTPWELGKYFKIFEQMPKCHPRYLAIKVPGVRKTGSVSEQGYAK